MGKFYVIGDVHGDDKKLKDLMSYMSLDEDTYVIMCGDVGLIYGDYYSSRLAKLMKRQPCKFIVMRGNHDARYWRELRYGFDDDDIEVFDMFGNQFMRTVYEPNIWYVRDEGGLYEIPEVGKCLFVPGAYSVDKWYRLRSGLPWEHDEQLTYREMEALFDVARSNAIDFVFSHTCPLSWREQFSDLLLNGVNDSIVDTSMEKWMDPLYDIVKDTCKVWYFGHYHGDRGITNDGERYVPTKNDIVAKMLYNTWDIVGGH